MNTVSQAILQPLPRPGLWQRLQNHLHNLTAAHARQARFNGLDASVPRDTGLPPEMVLGQPAYDAALPFFLQSRFDRRD